MDRIIAVVGLPRSGTTLTAALLGAHSGHITCFEPWNQDAASAPSPEISPAQLCDHFGLGAEASQSTLVVKETSVDFEGIQWLARFLETNRDTYRIHIVWILRCFRHGYLSFIEAGQKHWGNADMVLGPGSYFRWVTRSQRAVGLLKELASSYPTTLFTYEHLACDQETTLSAICDAIDLTYEPAMLKFADSLERQHVRGDVGLLTEPQPVFSTSLAHREAQWQDQSAKLVLSGADGIRRKLDAWWESVGESSCLPPDKVRDVLESIGHTNAVAATTSTTEHQAASTGLLAQGIAAIDVRAELENHEQWLGFIQKRRHLVEPESRAASQARVLAQGFQFDGRWARPSQVRRGDGNIREGLVFDGMNARQRAVLLEFELALTESGIDADRAAIYMPESLSPFAAHFREHFSGVHGSEYFAEEERTPRLAGVPREDITALTFADNSQDFVIVNEVFEHLPNIDAALQDLHRVMKPGAVLLSTFPFLFKKETGTQKAILDRDGQIQYLTEPEYHGDPVNAQGVLVYRLPAWDIVEQTRTAGFKHAVMVFRCQPSAGVLADGISGIFILKAVK
ncbi:MAG: methyltransferase domain-containing protein [Pseudomonadota bacterium]